MKPVLGLVAAAFFLTATVVKAEDARPADESSGPGLGEIMSLQQMRHIKLWFAASRSNWPLADYEIGELKEGFGDVSKLLGGDIVDKHVGAPIAALEKAIDARDRASFASNFDKLTAGCNACHHTLDHAFIAIQRPASLPYSDQSFEPQK
jgi:hypothetical protein